MSATSSAPALRRVCSGSGRQTSAQARRSPPPALASRCPAGLTLARTAHLRPARRLVARAGEESEAKAETAADSVTESADSAEDVSGEVEGDEGTAPVKDVASVLAAMKEAVAGAETEGLSDDLAFLQDEFTAMTEKVNEAVANAKQQETIALAAKEQFLRSKADFENYRKRTENEKEALKDDVKSSVVTDFLPLIDNFELAGKQLKLETEGEKRVDSAYQALYRQMVDIFKQLGVNAVDTVGTAFNPEVHDAIMQEPSEEVEDGMILEEFRRGFCIGEKLIRPAMVKVAINDSAPSASASEESGEVADEADSAKQESAKES